MTLKYDYRGNLVETGDATSVTLYGVTHAVFAPTSGGSQLLTRCGRRACQGELGDKTVDCNACLER